MTKKATYGNILWMNGKYIDSKDVPNTISNQVLHYGNGVFEGIRAYKTPKGTAIFRLDDHLKRLFYSMNVYYIENPYDIDAWRKAIIALVKKNEFDACFIRPFIFVQEEWDALMPSEKSDVQTLIRLWQMDHYFDEKTVITAKVASYHRISSTMIPMHAKASATYMNAELLKREARKAGNDEAIALDMNGNVSGASNANIFLVFGTELHTPSLDCSVLNGITRQTLIQIASELGYSVVERHIARDDLYAASEVFLTGTAAEIKSIVAIDDIQIGDGSTPVGTIVANAYQNIVTGQYLNYNQWLTYID